MSMLSKDNSAWRRHRIAMDAFWNESKHPRDKTGKFGKGSGGGKSKAEKPREGLKLGKGVKESHIAAAAKKVSKAAGKKKKGDGGSFPWDVISGINQGFLGAEALRTLLGG